MSPVPNYSSIENFLRPRLGPWTVCLYLHRKPLLDAVAASAPTLTGTLLDIGCGNKPYSSILATYSPQRTYVGVDVASSPHDHGRFDAVYDSQTLPFSSGQFDSALCTEVLEHCKDPRSLVREIARVLKPGGHVLITVPFVIHHHEEPYDFQRLTKYGMEEIVSQAGLDVIWMKPRGGVFVVLVYSAYLCIGQVLSRRPFIDVVLWCAFPFALLMLLLDRWRGRPRVISLGWQMLARKVIR